MIRIWKESFTDQKLFATQKKQLSVSVNAIINYAKNHGQADIAEIVQNINSELQEEVKKIESFEAEVEFSDRTPLSDRDAALLLQTEGLAVSDILDVYGAVKGACNNLATQIRENKFSEGSINLRNIKVHVTGSDGTAQEKVINGSEKIVERMIRSRDSVSGLAIGPYERVIAAAIDGKVGNGRKAADVIDHEGKDFCEVKYLKTLKNQCHSSLGKKITCPTVVFYGADSFNPNYFIIPTTLDLSLFFNPVDIRKNRQRLNMVPKADSVAKLKALAGIQDQSEDDEEEYHAVGAEAARLDSQFESYEIVG